MNDLKATPRPFRLQMIDERSYARLGSNQWLDRVGLNGIPLNAAARRSWGPSGSHPWLLGGSEDPWLSVPVFRRVWLNSFNY
jgi:hypothetical protein